MIGLGETNAKMVKYVITTENKELVEIKSCTAKTRRSIGKFHFHLQ